MNKKLTALLPFLVIPGAIILSLGVVGLFAVVASLIPDVTSFGITGLAVGCVATVVGGLAVAYRCEIAAWLCGKRVRCPLKGMFDCVA